MMLSVTHKLTAPLLRHHSFRRSFSTLLTNPPSHHYYIAIVGSGPSSFYTAKYLLDANESIYVDIYEKLPLPYGLVRYGVAPDHPEVKTASTTLDDLFHLPKTSGRIRYFGNVEIGPDSNVPPPEKHAFPPPTHPLPSPLNVATSPSPSTSSSSSLPLSSLLTSSYSAVVLAYGAYSDHALGLPHENEYTGILSSREFVNWYNGHPLYRLLHESKHLKDPVTNQFRKIRNVVIVGNGNVAIDCARVCLRNLFELAKTDINDDTLRWIEHLQQSLERVYMIGRRGHIQSSFTIKELRELSKLTRDGHAPGDSSSTTAATTAGTTSETLPIFFDAQELAAGLTEASRKELENNRPKKRIIELMDTIHKRTSGLDHTPSASHPAIEMRFLLSPTELVSDGNKDSPHIQALVLQKNHLTGEPFRQRAVAVKEDEDAAAGARGGKITLPCDLLIKSIGYKNISITSWLPFNTRTNTIPNDQGKVLWSQEDPAQVEAKQKYSAEHRLYVTGWLKRGPTGIIGTNIVDAKETTAKIVEAIAAGQIPPSCELRAAASIVDPVEDLATTQAYGPVFKQALNWKDVIRVHQLELENGEKRVPPKLRVKYIDREEILKIAKLTKADPSSALAFSD